MDLTRAGLGSYGFDTVPREKRQRENPSHFASYSDCRRIFQVYEVLLSWISKGDYEWPGDHKEVRRLLRRSDSYRPVLRPFIEEIDRILDCGANSYNTAKRYLKVRKILQFKSPEEMYDQLKKRSELLKQRDERLEFEQIRREELERARLQAVRTKIRAEIEDELRAKIGQELGFQDAGDEQRLIPESVKFKVWRRDGGKCVRCGSQRGLEFDHIIPFSKGGSNTARNIQLLCESCNRSKSDSI